MTNKIKTISLISLTVALLSIIFLSASLSNLELDSGIQLQGGSDTGLPDRTFAEMVPEGSRLVLVINGVLAIASLALLVYVILRLSVYINLKSVGIAVLVFLILAAVIYLVPETDQGQTAIRLNEYPRQESTLPPTTYRDPLGAPPDFLYLILLTVTAIGLGYIAYGLIRDWKKSPVPESALTQTAQEALNDLKVGLNLRNVILRCYFQMTATLQKEQGVERQETMTVREFEDTLEHMGYPAEPVHQLTALFEHIRYGGRETTLDDERKAMESLEAIIQFAQQKGESQ